MSSLFSGLKRIRCTSVVTYQARLYCCGPTFISNTAVTTNRTRTASIVYYQSRVTASPQFSIAGNDTKQARRGVSSTPALTHQRVKGRSRFYKKVTIREVARDNDGGGDVEEATERWEVLLDGRVLKTPARQLLVFDSPELALAVAAEWDSQTSTKGLEPCLMPLMSLACTAIDQVSQDRERVITTCLKYLPTDTLCFLAANPDPVTSRRQRQLWTPLRDWAGKKLGITLGTTTGISDRPQYPPEALANARALLEACDDLALAAIQSMTMECKSLIIALAVAFRKTTVQKAFDAARLEEEYNVERWGMIAGGHDMDRANTNLTLAAASTILWLRSASLPKVTVP